MRRILGVRAKQKTRGNTISHRLLQGIWLNTQKKDGANTSGLLPPKDTVAAKMML